MGARLRVTMDKSRPAAGRFTHVEHSHVELEKLGFVCDRTASSTLLGAGLKQKLHIRKDHIQTKNFGKKKLSNRRAFSGELAVKMGHF